ncbi:MAG: type II toxin-antitoxin system prevent-host-death family antitoxin [Rhodocyclaceae bacterium]|nr:type II toxin-antitoxin system prevent-host-death family antitoxin [Rhodocyclaceae bacterium]
MISVNIHEAKAKLSEYLAAVEAGEIVQICRRNVPIAQLVPISQSETGQRPIGLACDAAYEIPDSFFDPLPEDLLKAFNGELSDPVLSALSYGEGSESTLDPSVVASHNERK